MRAIPELNILIEGHTDSLPIRNYCDTKFTNKKGISLMRAKAAASIQEGATVPTRSIIIKGYGGASPMASNTSPEGRAKNRRIEIWLVLVGQAFRNGE
jgi:flagellar motor protein MotB